MHLVHAAGSRLGHEISRLTSIATAHIIGDIAASEQFPNSQFLIHLVNEIGATFRATRFRIVGSCRGARTENLFGIVPALECFAKLASHANDFCGELNEPLF